MAIAIPSLLLKQLHTFGSLKNTDHGVEFSVKNRLSDTRIIGLTRSISTGSRCRSDRSRFAWMTAR